mmetsp:Transcript_93625/g.264728  ORF Transcript_93625/g.264728 Transcript_93625/m.264728 type:complete len:437 (+) Transcript_93625:123-1433(+)
MSFSLATVQQTFQTCSMGRAAHGRSVCGALIFATVSALCHAIFATPGICCGTGFYIEIDVVLFSLGILGYFFDFRDTNGTKEITESKKPTSDIVHGSPSGSRDQLGHERHAQHAHHTPRPKSDMHIIECVQRGSVAHTSARVLEAMHASIRLGHGGAAVKLFDQMLEKGAVLGAHLIHKAVSNKFFHLVAETLDDKRIQTDGLRLLDLVRAHGIHPSPDTQNRLLHAWKGQPPKAVVEYFVHMKSAGFLISKWAYRCIVVFYMRSDPEFALGVCKEMERSGIKLHRAAYNAALCARLQLGMHREAQELCMEMDDHLVAPNAASFCIMIRVYSVSGQPEKAITIFEAMREQSLEADRASYHYAIRSCIMLQRVEYAVELYKEAAQANVPLCASTYAILTRACKDVGWKCLASKLEMEWTRQQPACMEKAGAACKTEA